MDYVLYHHGIKGMKWGVRRTPAQLGHEGTGQKNSTQSEKSHVKKSPRQVTSENSVESENNKKDVHKMSDDELVTVINRLRKEKEYNDLMSTVYPKLQSEDKYKKMMKEGRDFVTDIVKKSGQNIGQQYVTYVMGTAINKIAKEEIVNPKKGQKDK